VIEKYINIQDYFCTFVLDFKPKAKFFFRQISPNFFFSFSTRLFFVSNEIKQSKFHSKNYYPSK